MPDPRFEGHEILEAIRKVAADLGHPPSRREFEGRSGVREYQILKHFPSWREAVRAAGLEVDSANVRLSDEELLSDWRHNWEECPANIEVVELKSVIASLARSEE